MQQTPATFDTHAAVKQFLAAGFSERQAEVVVEAMRDLGFGHLATKQDVKELRQEMAQELQGIRQEIKDLEKETKQEFQKVRQEMAQEFQGVRQEIKDLEKETKREFQSVRQDMKDLENRLIIKMGAMLIVAVGIILGYATFPARVAS